MALAGLGILLSNLKKNTQPPLGSKADKPNKNIQKSLRPCPLWNKDYQTCQASFGTAFEKGLPASGMHEGFTIPIDFKDLVAHAIQEVASDPWQNSLMPKRTSEAVKQRQNGEDMVNRWNKHELTIDSPCDSLGAMRYPHHFRTDGIRFHNKDMVEICLT